jgi:hypothetical protein
VNSVDLTLHIPHKENKSVPINISLPSEDVTLLSLYLPLYFLTKALNYLKILPFFPVIVIK